MLSQEDFKVGTKVRCVYECWRKGHIGTITDIPYNSGETGGNTFTILWDDGDSDPSWSCLDSFELESKEDLSDKGKDKREIEKEIIDGFYKKLGHDSPKEIIANDPCPLCYYGIGNHSDTCKIRSQVPPSESSFNGF